MGRSPCCDEIGLKKGPWTTEEDQKLVQHIQKHGHGSWRALPKLAGLNRCGKSCRLRWTNYLRPDIKRGKFSEEEEKTILNLHSILGNKWSAIATHLPGRTDNEIKNYWNTHLKKKLLQMGFDPMTHRPRTDLFASLPQLIALANLKELIEQHHSWEELAGRLQTEAVQMAKLQYLQYLFQPGQVHNPPVSSSPSFPNNNTDYTDITTPMFDMSTSLSSLGSVNELTHFDHLPELQAPLMDKCDFTVQGEDHCNDMSSFPWFQSSSSSSSQSPASIAVPPLMEAASISHGDHGEDQQSFWSEFFLEDSSLLHEIF